VANDPIVKGSQDELELRGGLEVGPEVDCGRQCKLEEVRGGSRSVVGVEGRVVEDMRAGGQFWREVKDEIN
jgi:hypothetical protein